MWPWHGGDEELASGKTKNERDAEEESFGDGVL